MNIAICDDEKILCDLLTTQIKAQLEPLQISHRISVFKTPSALYDAMQKDSNVLDLIFMDLEFNNPIEDGITWAKKIHDTHPDPLLIILTSYEERYKEGYIARAFRFMTKPINDHELKENLSAAIEQLQIEQRICITVNGKTRKISERQILYMAAQSGGSDVHTAKNIYFKEGSLLYWETILSSRSFFRIHKKYLVNLHYVKEITNHTVVLTNNEKLPVSRRKWTALRLAYMKFDIQEHM